MEVGKLADLIVVEGDPVKDGTTLERVKFVMKGGAVFRSVCSWVYGRTLHVQKIKPVGQVKNLPYPTPPLRFSRKPK